MTRSASYVFDIFMIKMYVYNSVRSIILPVHHMTIYKKLFWAHKGCVDVIGAL